MRSLSRTVGLFTTSLFAFVNAYAAEPGLGDDELDFGPDVRVHFVLKGEHEDHLGVGVCGIGDVNGDGVPDFLCGSIRGAYWTYGPGRVEARSGRDGSLLYAVHGRQDFQDGFGDRIVDVGDVDGDGARDFAVYAWQVRLRDWEVRGTADAYVSLFSGARGDVLTRWRGLDESLFSGSKGDPWISAAGDCDADGLGDVMLGCEKNDTGPWSTQVLSAGAWDEVLRVPGRPGAPTGDWEGDGRPDVLVRTRNSLRDIDAPGLSDPFAPPMPSQPFARLRSGASGEVLLEYRPGEEVVLWSGPVECGVDVNLDGFADPSVVCRVGREGPDCLAILCGKSGRRRLLVPDVAAADEQVRALGAAGDWNGDGHPDLYTSVVPRSTPSAPSGVPRLCIYSGRDGCRLVSIQSQWIGRMSDVATVGDINGDGADELALGYHFPRDHCGQVFVLGSASW